MILLDELLALDLLEHDLLDLLGDNDLLGDPSGDAANPGMILRDALLAKDLLERELHDLLGSDEAPNLESASCLPPADLDEDLEPLGEPLELEVPAGLLGDDEVPSLESTSWPPPADLDREADLLAEPSGAPLDEVLLSSPTLGAGTGAGTEAGDDCGNRTGAAGDGSRTRS